MKKSESLFYCVAFDQDGKIVAQTKPRHVNTEKPWIDSMFAEMAREYPYGHGALLVKIRPDGSKIFYDEPRYR